MYFCLLVLILINFVSFEMTWIKSLTNREFFFHRGRGETQTMDFICWNCIPFLNPISRKKKGFLFLGVVQPIEKWILNRNGKPKCLCFHKRNPSFVNGKLNKAKSISLKE